MKASLRSGALGGTFAVALLLASTAALSQAPRDTSDNSGMVVMSDTREWCAHLQGEVTALAEVVTKPHVQADKLASEGGRLCALGRIRLGIMRLRYALLHLQAIQQGSHSVQTAP